MGMYTELVVQFEIKKDAPTWVDRTLRSMAGIEDPAGEYNPQWKDHPLFETDRWSWMLNSGGAVYMWGRGSVVDQYGRWSVAISLKNYGDEIGKFLDWVAPHIRHYGRDFLGFKRYEENEDPTLIYIGAEGDIEYMDVHHADEA